MPNTKFDAILRESNGTPAIFVKGFEMVELERQNSFPNRIFEEISPISELPDKLNDDLDSTKFFQEEDTGLNIASATPKRRKEWISGRILLRRAVVRLISNNGNGHKKETAVKIIANALGKPTAYFSDSPDSEFAALTSSHSMAWW